MMEARPRFLQGVLPFSGEGLDRPLPLDPPLEYVVPSGCRSQLVYLRGGNSTDELVSVLLLRDGEAMRYFPIGARSNIHVALRVVEDLMSDTRLELRLAAPKDTEGYLVIDVGLMEV